MNKPTKKEVITWLITFLVCALLFLAGLFRENRTTNIKDDYGNFILCDTSNVFTRMHGQ